MRLENAARNVKTAWLLHALHIICQFVSRTVIIYVLTIEYVGLSSLFSNILTMLSLAELGVGEAIIFSLYGPIARNEQDVINRIMNFYRKVYISVGCFVLVLGSALTPFIGHFIKDMPDIPNIHLIYVLYVVNSAVSYFFSYKSAFVTANQNNYIVVLNNGLFEVAMVAVQAVILFTTKNYVAYMIAGICFVLVQNISITVIADKKYPYIKEHSKSKMPAEIFDQIKKNTWAMVFHKIGTIIVFATDNLIISKFIGLVSVGIYTNYCTITNAVTTFISKFFTAISASVGNLAVEESVEVQEKTLFRVLFINFWLYVFSCCCLYNLLNPFIRDIWLSEKYLFGNAIVLLIVVKIYITGLRGAAQTFKNAKGLYWYNKYMPIYESLINLAVSLLLVSKIGVSGVLIGTIISSVLTCVWIEPHVLYKYGFNKSAYKYYAKYILYFVIFILIMGVTAFVDSFVTKTGFLAFIMHLAISVTVPNLCMVVLFRRTDEFGYMVRVLKRRLK